MRSGRYMQCVVANVLMSSNAVITSAGGLDTEPAVARVVIHAAIVLMSALTGSTSGLLTQAWIDGPSDAAVEASMFGHAAASFDWKSVQKLWSPADIDADADPDAMADASADGATDGATEATLGSVSGVEAADGAALDPVDEQAARPIAVTPMIASMERRMDMTTSRTWFSGSLDGRGRSVPFGGTACRRS
jgi:hypothetical protein